MLLHMIDIQALTLFNAIAAAGKTIYGLAEGATELEEKQQLMEVYDTLMSLKRAAGDLEDENRELKGKLRFKTDEFDFDGMFWHDKNHPQRLLCPKCFSKETIGPVGEAYDNSHALYRRCLVCDEAYKVGESRHRGADSGVFGGNSDSWMG